MEQRSIFQLEVMQLKTDYGNFVGAFRRTSSRYTVGTLQLSMSAIRWMAPFTKNTFFS